MTERPTPEQAAAAHDLGQAMLRFLLALRPEPPKAEKQPPSLRPTPEPPRPTQAATPFARGKEVSPVGELMVGTREAARLLSLSERTLWTLTAPRGPIPAVRIGRIVRYPVDALRDWVKQSKV